MLSPRFASALLLSACSLTPQQAADRLSGSIEKIVDRDDDVRHAILHISSPTLQLEGTWTAGPARQGSDAPMTAETPFLAASIGKLFTAATVLSLAEAGVLSLEDDLTVWLESDLTDDLPLQGDPSSVTLQHLLSHTSGLPDYFVDETKDGAPNLMTLLVEQPDRTWSPQAVLAYTGEHFAPVDAVGAGFHYADTNYDLLGLVVEAAAGKAFHAVVRQQVLTPLGLRQTWYYNHESPPDGVAAADVWLGDFNAAGVQAMSLDWAGGGLMTTTGDLSTFLRGLDAGQPVSLDQLGATMLADSITDGIDYGYGLWRVRPDGLSWLLSGPELIGVSGLTGSYAYLIPETDTVITGTFDQSQYSEEHIVYLVTKVLPTLQRVQVE